jgi:SagB-type dehydrogenase family enzyme
MKRKSWGILILMLIILPACSPVNMTDPTSKTSPSFPPATIANAIELPEPRITGTLSLEESLHNRRSVREYSQSALILEEVSQLLWSAQGITADNGGRSAPSAGGLYPLEVYLIAGNVENLSTGIYRYIPQDHGLTIISNQDVRNKLSEAALGQAPVKNGAIDIIISAVYSRTTGKYGDRGIRYVQMEAGHAAQNICLEATALKLGAVTIGAFDDNQVKICLILPENESPLYIIPVGAIK